jgi:hypothetical protein
MTQDEFLRQALIDLKSMSDVDKVSVAYVRALLDAIYESLPTDLPSRPVASRSKANRIPPPEVDRDLLLGYEDYVDTTKRKNFKDNE